MHPCGTGGIGRIFLTMPKHSISAPEGEYEKWVALAAHLGGQLGRPTSVSELVREAINRFADGYIDRMGDVVMAYGRKECRSTRSFSAASSPLSSVDSPLDSGVEGVDEQEARMDGGVEKETGLGRQGRNRLKPADTGLLHPASTPPRPVRAPVTKESQTKRRKPT